MGFVMIYKATEMVNFAQGDIMMVGTFVALTLTTMAGANFFIAVLCAILIMAVFGFLVDRVSYPQNHRSAAIFNRNTHNQSGICIPFGRRHDMGPKPQNYGHAFCRQF